MITNQWIALAQIMYPHAPLACSGIFLFSQRTQLVNSEEITVHTFIGFRE